MYWRVESNSAEASRLREQVNTLQSTLGEEQRKRRSLANAVIQKAEENERITKASRDIQKNLFDRLQKIRQDSQAAMNAADELRAKENNEECTFDVRGLR